MRVPSPLPLLCAAVSAVLVASCAHIATPGGGPPDTTPPRVSGSVPSPGSTGVSTAASLRIEFSEWVEPRSVEPHLTLLPPPPEGVRVKVSGRTVEIIPRRGLAESTTYHLELGAGIEDLRRNPMGTPVRVVFSTGTQLDSASIAGCVIDPRLRVLQPKVALFSHSGGGTDDTLWFSTPDYLTQSDSAGRFSFDHVREGAFRLLACTDRTNLNRFQPGREQQAWAPTDPVVQTGRATPQAYLYPVNADTVSLSVVTLRPRSATLLMGSWSRAPLLPGDTAAAHRMRIEPFDSLLPAPRIDTLILLENSVTFAIRLADTLRLTGYRLIAEHRPLFPRDTAAAGFDTLRFNGITTPDTVAPRIVRTTPAANSELHPRITVVFSKPVTFLDSFALCIDTAGDTIPTYPHTVAGWSDTLVLQPLRALAPGTEYRHLLRNDAIADLSGNTLRDTTDTTESRVHRFSTIAADQLCDALAADSSCFPYHPDRWWIFTPFAGGGEPLRVPQTPGGGFRFENVPEGKGTLSWVIDPTGTGVPSPGRLIPWHPPAEHVVWYDTLEARARWEIEGVPTPSCDLCNRGQLQGARQPEETPTRPRDPPRTTIPRPGFAPPFN